MDPYAVMGVDHDATTEQIRRQYMSLALQLHPDKAEGGTVMTSTAANCNTDAAGEPVDGFQQLQAAWEILRDDAARHAYVSL